MPQHTPEEKRKNAAAALGSGGARGAARKVASRSDKNRAALLQTRRSQGIKLSDADQQFMLRFAQTTDNHQ